MAAPLLLALSCEGSDTSTVGKAGADPGNAAGTGGTDPGEPTQNASYYVPVADELAAWATYPVRRVSLLRDHDSVRIGYGFPRWLGGVLQPIELLGACAPDAAEFDATVTGLGTARCTQTAGRFECYELLPGISVDRVQAEAYMREEGLSEEEIGQRLQVTDLFASDPIGVITFELAPPAP
jgi:hypothetical protein